jgi:hypothetical protein
MKAGIKWLGEGYKEIGKSGSGVYRSSDGLRQFRIDKNSLLGNHNPHKPHVHLETINPITEKASILNHIIIRK